MNEIPIHWRSHVTQDDVEAIHVLVASSGVFSAEEIDVAVELAEDALEHKEMSDYRFLLGERGGILAGYASYGRIPLTQNRFDLYWIVVDGNAQQQGVATAIIHETEARVRKDGGKILYAETSSRSIYAPAQAFYARMGYALLARLPDFYADGDDKLMYGKIL